eukprot:5291373-Alexandrium_andersonii.AAC.1
MARRAGNLMSRFRRDRNGRTAYHMIKGHACRREHAEFGECVWYLKPEGAGRGKAYSRWETGIWPGMRGKTGEYIIGAGLGVLKA